MSTPSGSRDLGYLRKMITARFLQTALKLQKSQQNNGRFDEEEK
jgi:hypothetical protein